ncbi:DUF2773 domain-containing protein [Escherichia coli]|uniref:DUF2773 domain-containing protein n=1 Tax=Escherichia coli TaxID=562 RepID=UPI000DA5363D|nr:DUF2773 domain-containing protein [Escherichia coli]EFT2865053.1 DUF2773 domain-containing protein [Escherichia coli]EFT3130692.1 DUF2773 domain-containing protein [Escherichia coli]EGC2475141.1 DUF2773 domain-containing protein [Escherichia coli]EGI4460654.1 DUF2773 domain-containing protein [Escherichia coli]ELC6145439.1 DUF2773 domain-containing protein [Escherichia coli]
MNRINILVICMVLFFMTGNACATEWISSEDLITSDFHLMTADERNVVKAATDDSMEAAYMLKDNIRWYYHNGNLSLPANFSNQNKLVVNGNLTISGDYDDYLSGNGHLIVLGNVIVDNFINHDFAYVKGQMTAKVLVYADYNDHNFEVMKGISARGIIVSDKPTQFEVIKAEFYINEDGSGEGYNWDENIQKAYSLVTADLYDHTEIETDNISNAYPDYDSVADNIVQGLPLFRDKAAPEINEKLKWIETGKLDNFPANKIKHQDPLVARFLTHTESLSPAVMLQLLQHPDDQTRESMAQSWRAQQMHLLTDELIKDEAVARGLVKNSNISADVNKKLMSVPVESVQLEQARQDNLSPDIVASLSHSPFLSVRKTLLSHYDYAWLVPTAVADELINNEDPELRERITGADLTAQQAVMLSKDKSLKVREALARTLTELKITQLSATLRTEDIERIAEQMYLDNKENKNIVKALLIALPEMRQLSLAKEDVHNLREGARYLTSREVISYLLTQHDVPTVWGELARDKLLPLEYKKQLWQRTLNLMMSKRQEDQEQAYEVQLALIDNGVVDEEMLNNAIDLLVDLPAEYRYRMRNQLFDNKELPSGIINKLDQQYRFNSDWALAVVSMKNSTRRQSERGLHRWNHEDSDIFAELATIKDKSDDEWWRALLQSRNDHLRQTALRNAHTPASLLTTLSESQDRSLAINNPQLAADVKTVWLKEDPSLLLFVDQPDLSQLRDLVKTGATRKIRSEARHRLEEKQ